MTHRAHIYYSCECVLQNYEVARSEMTSSETRELQIQLGEARADLAKEHELEEQNRKKLSQVVHSHKVQMEQLEVCVHVSCVYRCAVEFLSMHFRVRFFCKERERQCVGAEFE